ncbi:NAD(P)H-dependent glycerol-3-phosphate dehydrogenase [Mycoplasma struthionis]|uniref:Glycerol-3-phosphate dehydrogenase n=1 Tax=Mycoplasma struthionis TaxID=538220 RepID=A0A3G8LHG9_9MOLU|nr:NAD(P)H-dependent glycerol-3-phosphate dehydrogenase [Mycoplasma struthionis]AZG68794.1 NAD(P)H-dependent glycerol-3-phosphate dehydrogenase [Mycoplasma struthionis]
MKTKIAILGSGAMGSACASVLSKNGHNVWIYGIDKNELTDLKNGYNKKYFEDIYLGKFSVTLSLEEAVNDADYILIAIPSKFIPEVFEKCIKLLQKRVIIINVAKGFWPDTVEFVHERMEKLSKKNEMISGVVSLIGPSFAIDIVNENITLVDAVSKSVAQNIKVQKLFSNSFFRVYSQIDVKGAEAGAVFKNMIAIATGLAAGLGYSTNTQAAIITRAFIEIETYTKFIKGNKKTLLGLSCLGDLILTALSDKSRNYKFGLNFFNQKVNSDHLTVEGLKTIEIFYERYIKTDILKLPIIEALYQIIYLKKNPKEIITKMMNSPLKSEN